MSFQTHNNKVYPPLFILRKQIKMFLMKSGSFLTLHKTAKQLNMFKTQKGSKEIFKIVHVTSVIQQ